MRDTPRQWRLLRTSARAALTDIAGRPADLAASRLARRILANMPHRASKLTRQKAAGISVVDSWCVRAWLPPHTSALRFDARAFCVTASRL